MMPTPESKLLGLKIIQLLQVGHNNAITAGILARSLGESNDRRIRLAIEQLQHDGVAIASSVSPPMGYYMPANKEEAETYAKSLKDRARMIFIRRRNFRRAAGLSEPKIGQMALGI